jgi:predicted HicB family RNase H-like nuclease
MSDTGGLSDAVETSKGKDVSHLDDLLREARTDEDDEPDGPEMKRFNVDIPKELHSFIKTQAVREDRTMKDIFLDAIEMYLSQRSA